MGAKKHLDMLAVNEDVINRVGIGIAGMYEYTVNQDAASVAAATTGLESFTLTGVKAGEYVIGVVPPALIAGIGLGQPYVSADDTVIVPLINTTAGALDVLVGDWKFLIAATKKF